MTKASPYYNSVTDQSPFSQTAGAQHTLGEIMYYKDKKFRYCKAAEALTAGYPCSHYDGNVETLGQTSSTILTSAIGDTKVYLKNKASITANEFAGGFFAVTNSTGEGNTYEVSANTASVGSGSVTLTLSEATRAATLKGSSRGYLADSKYVVQVCNASSTAWESIVCVPLIDVSISHYFWGLVDGVCALRAGAGGAAAGAPICSALNTDGRVRTARSQDLHKTLAIGRGVIAARTSTEWGIVDLKLD